MTRGRASDDGARPPVPTRGRIASSVAAEFPGLTFAWLDLDVQTGASPRALRQRLAHESDRIKGADALTLVRRPIPSAYRVFFRQIGLDPETDRTPIEQIVLTRIVRGGLRSNGRLADACGVALLETGVPVWGLDRNRLSGDLQLEIAMVIAPDAEHSGLVITDAGDLAIPLFRGVPERFVPTPESSRVRLFAVGVPGVPPMTVDEALWLATQLAGD